MVLKGFGLFLLAIALVAPGFGQDPNSTDAKERKKAAEELKKEGASAIPTLAKLATDNDLDVRKEAVESIVEIGTQASLDPLLNSLKDNDPQIQMLAIDGLVNFYYPGYVKTGFMGSWRRFERSIKGRFTDVNTAIIDPYIQVRPEIIAEIGKLCHGGASIEARADACRAIGVLRGKAAVPDLVRAIRNHKEDPVLQEGLVALQKIRDVDSAKDIQFLLNDPKEKIQILAIETTGILRNEDALPDLERVLKTDGDKDVRAAALGAIGMMPHDKYRDLFKLYLNDRDKKMRASAAEGLGRIGDKSDASLVETMFAGEKDKYAKLAQAFALVKMGREEMTVGSPFNYLIDGLNSSSYVGIARPYLIELARTPSVLTILNGYITQGTKQEKIGLAQVLQASGTQSSLQPLDVISRDSDTEIAEAGLTALRNLKARLQ